MERSLAVSIAYFASLCPAYRTEFMPDYPIRRLRSNRFLSCSNFCIALRS